MELGSKETIGLVVGVVGILTYLFVNRRHSRLPPSPPFKLPYLGHLPYVLLNSSRKYTHIFYSKLAEKYGELCYLKLGKKDVVVVSSSGMIKDLFVNNPKLFSGRPQMTVRDMFTPVDFILDHSSLWRFHRKLAYRTLLLPRLLAHTETFISHEIEVTMNWLSEQKGQLFSPHAILKRASMSIISQLVFSLRFDDPDDPEFLALVQCYDDFFEYARGNLADYISIGKYLPNEGLKILSRASKIRDHHFNLWINSHVASLPEKEEDARDFVDALLMERRLAEQEGDEEKLGMLTDEALRGVCHDLFAAGTDTTSTTLEWLILYLAANPQVQSSLHAQLDARFGERVEGRVIGSKEAGEVEYVHAVINETLRKASIAPHMIPHMALEDCMIDYRFSIPKNTIIIPNVYHINNDPKVWGDADAFRPERFLEGTPNAVGWGSSSVNEQSNDGNLLAFGIGPRQCVGLKLAKLELLMFVANLCWKFSFQADESEPIDPVTQYYGITLQPKPYRIIAKLR